MRIGELEKEQLEFILARIDEYAEATDAVARTDLDALVLLAQQHHAGALGPET
ncbi:hypothetical protein ACH82I_16335 [Brevibacterium sp. GP-SGM9]|uniref:hypothetical protein n=1 Tax=unclassified Brevibacterium TaxID=2614124 RepID=UPI001E509E64|nr:MULTISPECIES: hypothetical protein [unclassified Brevibacterium]MDK8434827.1 hypothetical protein [Brevibacterium sp. H-BE7]